MLSQSTVKQKKMLHSLQTKTLYDRTNMERNTLAKTLTNSQSTMMCWTIQNKVKKSRNSAQAMQACTQSEQNKKHLCNMQLMTELQCQAH